jgi:hypothetical protein
MNLDLLNRILQALPLYSEEDGLREEVLESDLLERLPGAGGAEVLMCVRRLLEACALLDQRVLANGKWAFVSFPAALLGHSLVQTLAKPGQQIFESDYWRSDQNSAIEEQRTLLKQLENRRVRLHPSKSPEPIRFVFVAWGLVRLGGKFLLHHREDITRPDTKNYGFPGGRFRPGDLPLELQTPDTLRKLQISRSQIAIDALPRTLSREIFKELKLEIGDDCHASKRVILNPYRRVEGSQNKHAYTEYVLALYEISLTPDGEARLFDHIADSGEKLVWFSIEDLVDPTGRTDGKRAFIDALGQHFGNGLPDFLESVPSSSTTLYRFNKRAKAVEIPARLGDPVLIGETGKENRTFVEWSEEGFALLMLLGTHCKGLELEPEPTHLSLLPGGLIKAESEAARVVLSQLQATLVAEDLPLIQQVGEHYVRLAVDPKFLYFGEGLFSYRLLAEDDSSGVVELEFNLPASSWSGAAVWPLSIPVKSTMFHSLEVIESGDIGLDELEEFGGHSYETMKKNCKEMLDEKSRSLGLRKLVRQVNKRYKISVSCMLD